MTCSVADGAEGARRAADLAQRSSQRGRAVPLADPDGERRRGLDRPLPGSQRALPALALPGAQRDDRALRARRPSPRTRTLADWPLGYDELEPFYEAAERPSAWPEARRCEPLRGAARQRLPMPPLRRSGWDRSHRRTAARSLGWHPFPAPAAINSIPYNGNAPAPTAASARIPAVLPRCQGLDGRDRDPPGRGDRGAADRDRRSRPARHDGRRRARDGRGPTYRTARARRRRPGRPARHLHL